MEKKINLSQEHFGTLAICAIRYCHGRQTYMPSLVQGILIPHLQEFSDNNLAVMYDDCEFQKRLHLYGDERIDKPGWLLWEQKIHEEIARRANERKA